jgi:hypothetical protein
MSRSTYGFCQGLRGRSRPPQCPCVAPAAEKMGRRCYPDRAASSEGPPPMGMPRRPAGPSTSRRMLRHIDMHNASPLPDDRRAWLDERQGTLPACPQSGQAHPKEAIGRTKPGAADALLVDRELMPQREIFQVERCTCPEQCGDAGQQDSANGRKHRGPHHNRITGAGNPRHQG